ncbi:sulfotransferase family cytosolic 1B member 1-like [Sarcophilus harrisii]|uniref:Sulfotransferase n=1 Tax=Sarcophilus harrisii TaxID=9305 RepID=A0A7N4NRA9_SARHA|nr:sulfotransferase family cytosolic 1B member 1-like [Sarcophilus harrisii]XP_023362403.1 sulfotransferase family cytosolic 1B member 1-like [Sarcophilus harrisii]
MSSPDFLRHDFKIIHGYPMVYAFTFNWERIEQFQCRPEDIWIITYPKSGTTWMSEIMDLIKNDGFAEKQKNIPITERIPMLESAAPGILPTSTDVLEKLPSPRFVKSHLPIPLLPKNFWESNCKVIYVARNAKDVAVSYYHFDRMNKFHPDPGTFAEYLEKFMSGNVSYGHWHEHVISWWEKKKDHPILYLFYEDIKEDPKREIKKVMQFLGKKFDEETLDRIVQHTSFESMKDNLMVNYKSLPTSLMDHNISPFMRKGIAGDWKNYFTVAQNEKFDADYEKKMSGTTLKFRTEI